MVAKLSAIIALVFVIFLTVSAPASASPCGSGKNNGVGSGKNDRECPPNKHGVPGPIAGVGLPFLIAGMVAYRRRRKTESDDTE